MGSRSDWQTMSAAAQILEELGVPHEVRVVSAHRTPDLLFEYAATAQERGGRLQAHQGVAVVRGLAGSVVALQGGELGILDGERYSAGKQGAHHEASYGDRPPGHGARDHCAAPMHWRYSALRRVSRPGSTWPPA